MKKTIFDVINTEKEEKRKRKKSDENGMLSANEVPRPWLEGRRMREIRKQDSRTTIGRRKKKIERS